MTPLPKPVLQLMVLMAVGTFVAAVVMERPARMQASTFAVALYGIGLYVQRFESR